MRLTAGGIAEVRENQIRGARPDCSDDNEEWETATRDQPPVEPAQPVAEPAWSDGH